MKITLEDNSAFGEVTLTLIAGVDQFYITAKKQLNGETTQIDMRLLKTELKKAVELLA